MDVEWAIDGLAGHLFIVQARPETIHSRKATDRVVEYKLINPDEATPDQPKKHPVITTGIAIGDRAGVGKVRILFSLDGRGGGGPMHGMGRGRPFGVERTANRLLPPGARLADGPGCPPDRGRPISPGQRPRVGTQRAG